MMMAQPINNFADVSKVLSVPHSEAEYQRRLSLFEKLMDIVGDNKAHPLSSLMETLSILIENYETEHYSKPEVPGNEILEFLMEQNGLTPNDLSEIADVDELLEIINGDKELNALQIRSLSNRFHVSPAVFI
jgi:HTH-type transcriptional regulator/antitoxin HigA